jgi:WhiB family redox-sensing transcriptional regulator
MQRGSAAAKDRPSAPAIAEMAHPAPQGVLMPAPCAGGTAQHTEVDGPDAPVELLEPFSPACPEDLPCRIHDRELWFAESPVHLEMAKQFCRDCPARLGCLAGAVERREPWGVWGGEIFQHGVITAVKRARGRPRKTQRDAAA